MKYRQWKKNYKKIHGANPPLELDKRKQRKLAKKKIKHIRPVDFATITTRAAEVFTNAFASVMRGIGGVFDAAGTACRDIADNAQPIDIQGRVHSWQVKEWGNNQYAVHELNALDGTNERRINVHSLKAAEKIAEILESDYLEHVKRTRPDKLQRRNDVADNLQTAVIKAYEKGGFGQ